MSSVRGAAKLRRLIRRMPEAVQQEIVGSLDSWGRELGGAMRARTPRRRGTLLSRIRHKVFPKSLRMQVGLLGSRKVRQRLFYARILDLGRKGQSVRARRRRKDGSVSTYAMNVGAIRAMRFVTGPLSDLRTGMNKHIKGIWTRALRRVSEGGE